MIASFSVTCKQSLSPPALHAIKPFLSQLNMQSTRVSYTFTYKQYLSPPTLLAAYSCLLQLHIQSGLLSFSFIWNQSLSAPALHAINTYYSQHHMQSTHIMSLTALLAINSCLFQLYIPKRKKDCRRK